MEKDDRLLAATALSTDHRICVSGVLRIKSARCPFGTKDQRWSGGTPQWFNYIAVRLYAEFEEKKLTDIGEQDLQAYINKVANDGYSESIVKNSILYLKGDLSRILCKRFSKFMFWWFAPAAGGEGWLTYRSVYAGREPPFFPARSCRTSSRLI